MPPLRVAVSLISIVWVVFESPISIECYLSLLIVLNDLPPPVKNHPRQGCKGCQTQHSRLKDPIQPFYLKWRLEDKKIRGSRR